MASTIKIGENKEFLCKIGLHKWGRWHGISLVMSNVIDSERKCHKCGQVQRKTRAKEKFWED
jgi:hypothetical protein